jgi:hypothetical protein
VSAAARRARRRRWPVLTGGTVLVLAAAALWWGLATTKGEASQAPVRTTATARTGTLTQTVDADFSLTRTGATDLLAPRAGVVTKVYVKAGQKLASLAPLVDIDGRTVWTLGTSTPFYRDLAWGDAGADVEALEHILAGAGYDPGDIDGVFDGDTAQALTDWQEAKGLDETGTFTLSSFVRFVRGTSLLDVNVAQGDKVGPATVLATAGKPSALLAEAEVNQLDVGEVKAGQKAELRLDGAPDTVVPGTVTTIADDTGTQDEASAGSTQVVQYTVELRPTGLPASARAGMTGQASIIVRSRTNVVIVPTAAVQGGADSPSVQVVDAGQVTGRPVVTGLATGDEVEIITGLRPGEQVVTGTISPQDQQQANQQQRQGPPGGFGPGGFGGGGRRVGGGAGGGGGR